MVTPLRLHLLTAGWTAHPGFVARRGGGRASVRFPALIAVIERSDGVVLFDTGYTPAVNTALRRGINRLYGALLPVTIPPRETALAQLAGLGIDPEQVHTIVLSHLHPDHLGGVSDFPGARVVTSPRTVAAMRAARGFGRLRRGWLPDLLPPDLEQRILNPLALPTIDADLAPLAVGRDLSGDGTLVVVPLPGHSDSDLGLLVRTGTHEVLLVGDAVWDLRAVTHGDLPHPVTRIATHSWRGYRRTVAALTQLLERRPSILVLPSHDEPVIERVRALLDGETHDGGGPPAVVPSPPEPTTAPPDPAA